MERRVGHPGNQNALKSGGYTHATIMSDWNSTVSGYYYRAALCLSSLLALTTLVVRGVIAHPNPEVATSLNPVITATFILPLGLWVGSNFIRYVGAALLVPWAGGLI